MLSQYYLTEIIWSIYELSFQIMPKQTLFYLIVFSEKYKNISFYFGSNFSIDF